MLKPVVVFKLPITGRDMCPQSLLKGSQVDLKGIESLTCEPDKKYIGLMLS